MEFLSDPGAPKPRLASDQEFVPPAPRVMPLPAFPAAALAAGEQEALVAVRLFLAEDGAIARVVDSPLATSTPGPFAADYRGAVEAAVARWIITPARIDTVGEMPPNALPGTTQRPLLSTKRVPFYLDFGFRFTVVDGRGVVTVTPASR